ncbi:LysR family transcriptional regulator [Pelagibius sp. Alg239-R121]|uniref:LysR family transcriptional regulator n=1 Tax=Pelagibius sp. Alg239-R121 TaxID=2993448 RepID=UPI0024A73C71|nr:LysR family transcriptional regulator [Pelagibius sp. Alg239-R121]
MPSRFHRVRHLLTTLPVLEAAARNGSFTRAGDELGLSQPTVSRHIANLEADLGVTLFTRQHNQLTLTREGRALADAIELGLSHIDAAARQVSITQKQLGLTLACTHSFAHGWLLPRFSSLRRATNQAPIHLVVSYWLEDVDLDEIDLVISWRTRGWTDWPRLALFDEVTYPVCSAAFLAQHPGINSGDSNPSQLSQAPLLNYVERDSDYVSWENWFSHFGCSYVQAPDAYRFSNYHFMIQAAIDGEGIALGWHHLVADQIAAGRLCRVGPAYKHRNAAYTLEFRDDRSAPDRLSPVLEWFRAEASKTPEISIDR